jgi:hypothetical protein
MAAAPTALRVPKSLSELIMDVGELLIVCARFAAQVFCGVSMSKKPG